MLKNLRSFQGVVIVSLALASSASVAQDACGSLDTALTDARAQEYAPLISQVAEGTAAQEVEFISFMESGSWSVAYAATPVADPGYFFFEDVAGEKQFKDVWGGVASVSEQPELVAWAEQLGAPADLSACFAETAAVIDAEESAGGVNDTFDTLFGEHEPFEAFFTDFKQAVAEDDGEAVAAMVSYPISVKIEGESTPIADEAEFTANYDAIFTPGVKDAVASQAYEDLFANWQGVMVGDGQVWFSLVEDAVKIIAINN